MTVPTKEEREAIRASAAKVELRVLIDGQPHVELVLRLLAAIDEVEQERDEARRMVVFLQGDELAKLNGGGA